MMHGGKGRAWVRRMLAGSLVAGAGLLLGVFASAAGPNLGVLVTLNPSQVASFDASHNVTAVRLNPNRDMYLVTSNSGESDAALLSELEADPRAGSPTLNEIIRFNGQSTASVLNGQSTASVLNGQSTASVLNGQSTASVLNGQSTASVLNGQSTASVLNSQSTASVLNKQSTASVLNQPGGGSPLMGESTTLMQSTASVLNTDVSFYGAQVPQGYVNQPAVSQIHAGPEALDLSAGQNTVVAVIDNGVAPFNPVLSQVLLSNQGWNFYDNSPNWSAWADLAQSTASVLNRQSTASVLNGQSTASVLNLLHALLSQSTASVLNGCALPAGGAQTNGQSTVSVLNGESTVLGQSTASVLNSGSQAMANLVLKLIGQILKCDPDFGHGTSVAGLIHLIAPQAQILPIKAFGPGGLATSADIYQSIAYAIDHHANVINMSFSASALDPAWIPLIQEAGRRGIVLVAAAGNSGGSAAVYPASMEGVLGVGAVDGATAPYFQRAGFSNFDPPTGIVDDALGAPGVNLVTTFPGFGLVWATVTGTSFSVPLVSGEAALLAALGQTSAASRDAIEGTADGAIAGDLDGGLGFGMVQVLGALKLAPHASPDAGSGHPHGH